MNGFDRGDSLRSETSRRLRKLSQEKHFAYAMEGVYKLVKT